mmetsp:Transcript_7951/g.20034  ORF Transcript_7951/g.20034 Transcript_7951/m.20034 type:complete len:201 (-) Transcript_7951:289-891(-)
MVDADGPPHRPRRPPEKRLSHRSPQRLPAYRHRDCHGPHLVPGPQRGGVHPPHHRCAVLPVRLLVHQPLFQIRASIPSRTCDRATRESVRCIPSVCLLFCQVHCRAAVRAHLPVNILQHLLLDGRLLHRPAALFRAVGACAVQRAPWAGSRHVHVCVAHGHLQGGGLHRHILPCSDAHGRVLHQHRPHARVVPLGPVPVH